MDVRHRNSYAGIEEYAVKLIKFKASKLVGKAGFSEDDREDLEQELMLDLICRLSKFDPKRAKRNTFINRVVTHRVATIIKTRKSGMRNSALYPYSLNDLIKDVEGNQVEYLETVKRDDYMQKTDGYSRPLSELDELVIDLNRVIERLPFKLRKLCEQLKEQTVSEISRNTGVSRETIYQCIKELRKAFEKAGMKKY